MSGNVQKKINFIETTMYHHGFMKMLIEFHLKGLGDDWEKFLLINHFKEEEEKHASSSKVKRGRKRVSKIHIQKLPQQQSLE